MAAESTADHSAEINTDVLSALGGMPAVVDGWQPPQGGWDQFWIALGQLEAKFQVELIDGPKMGKNAVFYSNILEIFTTLICIITASDYGTEIIT